MDLYTALKQLESYLSSTREFAELKSAKQIINKNPKIDALVTQFKQNQDALYSQKLNNSQIQKLMDELDTQYAQLSSVPEINRYFAAVDSFNQLMSSVIKELNTALELKLK